MTKSFSQEIFHTKETVPVVTFVDRPCGYGKTSDMLDSLRAEELYLIVVPSLTEVERVMAARPDLRFATPEDEEGTKSSHLKQLIRSHENVVCTHALYHLNVEFYREGWLSNYNIIVDEVLSVVETVSGPNREEWEEFYIGNGYATVDEHGLIAPTEKWHERSKIVERVLERDLYERAVSGCLYRHNDSIFLSAVSPYLLKAGKTCTVLSYMVEGSLMALYLRKMGIPYHVDKDPEAERRFRQSFRQLATVRGLDVGMPLSHSAQSAPRNRLRCKAVAGKLRSFKHRAGRDVFQGSEGVLVTCLKANWYSRPDADEPKPDGLFARGSRLAETAQWIPNTTRGTNDYKHCDVALYLWDQWLNPNVKQWLDATNEQEKQYALSEMLQWIYRTCLRDGKPATLVIGSSRMRVLLEEWADGGV